MGSAITNWPVSARWIAPWRVNGAIAGLIWPLNFGSASSLLHSCLHYSDRLRGEDRQDFETALHVVLERTDRLNAFMRNFADVFRLPPPNLQPCDVRSLIEDVTFLFKAECVKLRIEIVWDVQTKLEPVRMDRSQMEQVFVNVLKNAIESINDAGTVTIRLGKQAGRSFV